MASRIDLGGHKRLAPHTPQTQLQSSHTHHSPLNLLEHQCLQLAFSNRKVSALWHRNINQRQGLTRPVAALAHCRSGLSAREARERASSPNIGSGKDQDALERGRCRKPFHTVSAAAPNQAASTNSVTGRNKGCIGCAHFQARR